MNPNTPSRRGILGLGLGVGATFLAAPALAAAAPGRKLVVIVLRGAMDGLSASPPIGDPDYAALRGPIAIPADQALKLDDHFALHPKLVSLHAMALAGEARIAPSSALPQHIRSHFEAQDLLESGGPALYAVSTGWLNRALAASGPGGVTAISIGPQEPLILRGPTPTQSWSPGGFGADTGRTATVLQDLYKSDPLLGPAFASGLQTEMQGIALAEGAPVALKTVADSQGPGVKARADAQGFAAAAARFLRAPGGPSIAVLSLDGFDTHAAQGAAEGQLAGRLANLDGVLDGLKTGLGPDWSKTVVIAVTEFGRTARMNGTRGTDHGTASTLILAGGALKRGGIVGDWPGLAEGRLFEARDLTPTLDVRQVFKAVLSEHLDIPRPALETRVFPQSAGAPALSGLIRA